MSQVINSLVLILTLKVSRYPICFDQSLHSISIDPESSLKMVLVTILLPEGSPSCFPLYFSFFVPGESSETSLIISFVFSMQFLIFLGKSINPEIP